MPGLPLWPLLLAAAALLPRDGALWLGRTDGVVVAGQAVGEATVTGDDASALAGDVAWTSAPPVGARARLAFDPAAWRVVARAGGEPLVIVGARGVVIAADPADPRNAAFARWGYLPFVLHAAGERAEGRGPGRFADWPEAPVPHRLLPLAYGVGAGAIALALALGFAAARRRARAEPDAHLRLLQPLSHPRAAAWSRPGIARPLGGFLLFLSATLLAMGPYLYVTAVWVPGSVQPFPDVDGLWAPIEDLATLGWALVDVGMTLAFVQRFAEYRVSDPRRALACAQLYVWWSLLGGFVLFAAGGALACGVLPHTRYALFSRIVLIRTAMQLPGILSLFTTFFHAVQRFDYQLGLDLLEKRLLFVAIPIPFVLVLRAWGAHTPGVGEAFGALLGIAAGQYTALLCTAAIGFVLYRRLGLPLGPLFHAGFHRGTFRDMTRFGLGVVAGKAPFFIANAAEIAILTTLLPGYPAWLGIRQLLMSRLIFTLWFVWPFIESGIPAFAEAMGAKKHALARYYVVRYLQLGHLFVLLVIAFLVAAGRPLIRQALSAEWHPAATWLPLAAATGLFLPAAWTSDAFQKGAGRSGLDAAILASEQALRVVLFFVLVPRLGFPGIFVAILATLALKVAVAWTINHRFLLRIEPRLWTTVGAPLGTGGVVYGLLTLSAWLLPAGRTSAIGLFTVGAILLFPLGFYLVGLLGGLDPAAVAELALAAELAGVMRPVARLLARISAAAARHSPFRPALPALAAEAAREADEIVAAIAGPPG